MLTATDLAGFDLARISDGTLRAAMRQDRCRRQALQYRASVADVPAPGLDAALVEIDDEAWVLAELSRLVDLIRARVQAPQPTPVLQFPARAVSAADAKRVA